MATGIETAEAVAEVVCLGGEVSAPRGLTMADLRSLPQHEREVSFLCRKTGLRRHSFRGPLLLEVVSLAGPLFVPGERKSRLRFLISLRGGDGHRVVLSWAEIDPEFANQPVLLGVARDGVALDEEGPQLAMPADVYGARNLSGVTDLRVFSDPTG
ncbi:hypothetical protein EDD29_3651 [Actinocorallia herbida]|uniref:Molybdopterin-dependent oxidoreductase-like protein n=1 Tax=Actinocorallia herbida TaxID=58109 RepID=A0A3N1CXR6_9ACTN|nr:hypothetical protein [Actinocorallia herbida]ROO86089.1 hypothetical protein EDD29_3651 [Actinocorallia herbida]